MEVSDVQKLQNAKKTEMHMLVSLMLLKGCKSGHWWLHSQQHSQILLKMDDLI